MIPMNPAPIIANNNAVILNNLNNLKGYGGYGAGDIVTWVLLGLTALACLGLLVTIIWCGKDFIKRS